MTSLYVEAEWERHTHMLSVQIRRVERTEYMYPLHSFQHIIDDYA